MEEVSTIQTVETVDNSNSEPSLEEQISKALDEPTSDSEQVDTTQNEEKIKDNIIECPDKFKNVDGSVNVDKLTKSYRELEPLLNEKAEWQKERAELLKAKEKIDAIEKQQLEQQQQVARDNGFNSVEAMQQAYQVANYEANEYAKYLDYVDEDDRASVRELLEEYAKNPSAELMRDIEFEFSPEINKQIAVNSYMMQEQFNRQVAQNADTQRLTNIEGVIKSSVEENSELFEHKPFNDFFVNALQRYGENFTLDDSKQLMAMMSQMKDVYRQEFEKEYGIKSENSQVTDKLASISGTNSAPAASRQVDIDKLSNNELAALVRKLV